MNDDVQWAKAKTNEILFEIFVNIKAVNSGVAPKYFVHMDCAKDVIVWKELYIQMHLNNLR